MAVKRNAKAAPEPEDKALVAAAPEGGAVVDFWPHPLTSEGRRQSVAVVPDKGASLAAVLRQGGLALGGGPVEARVDGAPVARDQWPRRRVLPGQIVEARAAVQGGGDSEPFEIVSTIAAITSSLQHGAGLSLSQAALAAGPPVIGGLVANALFPVELPDAGAPGREAFSLHGGANRARPYEPAMLTLGTHRAFPDLAAQEYTQFIGGDQYLFQLFDFGVGDLDLSEIKIGDALLSSFADVEHHIRRPGQKANVIGRDIQTIAGGELAKPAGADAAYARGSGSLNTWGAWTTRASSAGAAHLELDFVGVFFGRAKKGEGELRNVQIEIQRREHGTDPNWTAAAATATTVTLANSATAAARLTVGVALTDHTKKWDVRARRKAALASNGQIAKRTTDQGVTWTALRTFQANTADATGRTRLELKIRASGQLQGRIERLSALVKQKVPTWNGTAWSAANKITSNPADIFRWFVKGVRAEGRLLAGLGLPDSRIDETSIRAWRTWCDGQGLKCDAVLTGSQSIADVLNMICRCGRASASWASGKLGVVFDQAGLAPTAMITPGNIIAGTLEVNYADGRLADEIVVRYLDPDFDWQPAELRRLKTGVTAPSRTATVTLQGIVNREQAKEETNLIAARQEHHRRRITWEMGPEGLTIGRGDVVQATSDLLSGGTTGRLQPGGTAASPVLNQEVNVAAGVNYMVFRLLDGTLHTSVAQHPDGASATGKTTRPVLTTPLPGLPDHGGLAAAPAEKGATAGDVLWRHYGEANAPRKLKIIEIEPRAMDRYRFTAIDEVAEYYAAAALALTDPLPELKHQGPRVIWCSLSEKQIKVANGWANEITATLTVAGEWRGGVIRARRTPPASEDEGAPAPVAEPWRVVAVLDGSQTSASWIDQPCGSLEVVVVPGSLVAPSGPAHACGRYTLKGDPDAPEAPTDMELVALPVPGGWMARWPLPEEPDYSITEVSDAPPEITDGDRATPRGAVKGSLFTRMGLAAATSLKVFVRHRDASGKASDWASKTVTTLPAADAFNVLWGGGAAKKSFTASNQTHAFRLRSLISQWDFLLIAGKATLDREWNAALIPAKALATGTSSRSVPGDPGTVRSAIVTGGDNATFVFDAWQSADHRDLFVRAAGNEPGAIYMIYGLRRSSGGGAGTAPAAPDAPTLLGGARQISVAITPVSGADGYDLRHKLSSAADAPANWTEQALGNGATSGSITGLADATRYDVQVRARNSAGNSPWSVSASATTDDAAPPSAPDAPTVSSGNQQLTVTWSEVSGATEYQVRRRRTGATSWTIASAWGSSRTRTLTGLTNGTSYDVQVQARNTAGPSPWSPTGTGTPAAPAPPPRPQPPPRPDKPTVSSGNRRLGVTWSAVARATQYQVRWRRNGTTSWSGADTGTSAWGSSRNRTLTDLTNGTSYDVQVQARNSAGPSPWSPTATGTPTPPSPPQPPPRPDAPTVTSGNRRLEVTWDAVIRATEYRVQRRQTGTRPWTTDSVWRSSRNRTLTDLTNGVGYDIQIQARNSAGPSPWSPTATGTPTPPPRPQPPPRPDKPIVSSGNRRLGVTWPAVARATQYQVRWRRNGTTSWSGADTGTSAWGSSRNRTLTDLTNGTSYDVQVQARNSAGPSPWSPTATGTPTPPSPPQPPPRPDAPTVTSGNRRLEVTWDAVIRATEYRVQRRTDTTSWTISAWGSSRNRTLTGLRDSTSYDVQIQARNTAGSSPWSLSGTGTTLPGTPAAPSVEGGIRRVTVSWSAPSSNGGVAITHYQLQYRTGSGAWTTGLDLAASSTSKVISTLRASTAYEVQVRAKNSAGWGNWSPSGTGTTLPGTPAAPTVVGGNQQLTVSWSPPSSNGGAAITHYQLRHRIGSSGAWETGLDRVASSTRATISTLRASTAYEVQVRAKNSAGWGNWSPSGPGTTDRLPAPAVTPGNRQLRVTWPAVSGATQYQVRRRRAGTTSWTIASTWGSSRTRRLAGLTNGTRYDVQYQARDSAGPWPLWSYTATDTPIEPVKFRGTLTVGSLPGANRGRGYNGRQGSLVRSAGTLSITKLTEVTVRFELTTLTISGSPPNSDSTFSTLRVGNSTLRRTSATYHNGNWIWTEGIGLPSIGSRVTVTLQ